MHDDVGHVAVHEDLAGQQADDLVGRHAAVGTADPEVFGALLAGKFLKKLRVAPLDFVGPRLVLVEQLFQALHTRGMVVMLPGLSIPESKCAGGADSPCRETFPR